MYLLESEPHYIQMVYNRFTCPYFEVWPMFLLWNVFSAPVGTFFKISILKNYTNKQMTSYIFKWTVPKTTAIFFIIKNMWRDFALKKTTTQIIQNFAFSFQYDKEVHDITECMWHLTSRSELYYIWTLVSCFVSKIHIGIQNISDKSSVKEEFSNFYYFTSWKILFINPVISEWVPFLNQGRIRQWKKRRMGFTFHMLHPRYDMSLSHTGLA